MSIVFWCVCTFELVLKFETVLIFLMVMIIHWHNFKYNSYFYLSNQVGEKPHEKHGILEFWKFCIYGIRKISRFRFLLSIPQVDPHYRISFAASISLVLSLALYFFLLFSLIYPHLILLIKDMNIVTVSVSVFTQIQVQGKEKEKEE